ncbi:hypothetical protein [Sinisalibacter aestuarii]|uniref:Sulfotransferase family protein n=1 Tax=Sinisalibacter aestuarii TaxID=2949426 RepID=A0ABQ5LPE8_9RHOB|nr:hypothetical protein [Sinisalibacter aestuarii]GKY86151.1 hypothetical protein STA1M1_00200 [Sinisalibacter aestuarii]
MTLVSYAHDFVYLRTRKTAGTSTEMYLQPFCMPAGRPVSERNPRRIRSREGIVGRRATSEKLPFLLRVEIAIRRGLGLVNWGPHMEAETVRDALDADFWQRALKVSSVRNPFTRLVSAHYWNHAVEGKPVAPGEQAIRYCRRMVRRGGFQDDRKIVMIGKAFVPDVLIRQVHLADDLTALAARLGLDTSRTALPVTKKTHSSDAGRRPAIQDFYDDETADIVRRRFAWAFTHGNYSLDVPT